MSAEDFYDKNLFYEKQLLHKAQNESDRSYTHWTLYYTNGNEKTALISGIISDPMVSFSIQHNFQPPDGLIGAGMAAVRGAFDTIDSISQSAVGIQSMLGTTLNAAIGEDNTVGAMTAANAQLDSLLAGHEGLQKFKSTLGRFPGSRIVSTLDYTRVYKGTIVNAGIPTLQTRLYHGIPMTRTKADADHLSIQSQVAELLEHLMGDDLSPTTGKSDMGEAVNNIVGVQTAPNGYVPSFEALNMNSNNSNKSTNLKGTFSLRYGDVRIDNLLVTGFQINLSTLVTPKDESTDTKQNDSRKGGRYLYADVVIQVEPCTYIGKKTLLNMMNMSKYPSSTVTSSNSSIETSFTENVETSENIPIHPTVESVLESKGKSIKDVKQQEVLNAMKTDYPAIENFVEKVKLSKMTPLERFNHMSKGIK